MIYRSTDMPKAYVLFRDLNTGYYIYIEYANTATGEVRGHVMDRDKNASATKKRARNARYLREISGILAFDVIDRKTGFVIDKARP